ncbi:CO or xanthine dehydrogenase, Mo-binding subunit [Thermosyntropha lipolytica DSM 11003]|uniref:CO or xanthine dehydrogenase, Mo-binding subunit n=1 Tax=Thermosyntropha lipolytica DSM 11003 TaxID=1123382 RepID=A0A1M5P3Q9_9FIRM|nr:molybdopterin cofactor-binding domain-containing protein [Thermosyntropha lipolytica]SHG96049.1 CO or xanthine dehydrogenase, Mo-binding subunit [Thermosyntropha lipolytica DSM 11003]
MRVVNKPFNKIDGMSLVKGKPLYTDDLCPPSALVVKVLRSPHAFARIKRIDTSEAEKLPGVECIFTYQNIHRKPFTRAGQCHPELSPYDKFLLDEYVRHVGDDVAIVAAVDEKTALNALKLIKVEYEVLKPVLDFETAEENPVLVHPEDDIFAHLPVGFDPKHNVACRVNFALGEVEKVLEECEVVISRTYKTQPQAQAMMETQRAFSYLDPYGRLVVVASTQIPFHARRILANALDIPASQIRVIKPRIGGGFGAKQTVNAEFYPALVTLKTGKPAKIVYTRSEVFNATTTRHAMKFTVTIGAMRDGKIRAIDVKALSNTGAYGEHAETTLGAAGKKVLPLYNKVEAVRFSGTAVYTNMVPGGALRGFGVTQGTYALESAVNELAAELNMDPTLIRDINMIKKGETTPLINMTTKGAGPDPMYMDSCMLDYCVKRGKELIKWEEKYPKYQVSRTKVRGLGMAIAQQGSGLPNIDMAAATIKLNDDGFFNLLVGATDLGTGAETILAQIAAETLGVDLEQIVVYSSDTDATPFDTGAYASSTTYTTGNAVIEAAVKMKEEIIKTGALYFNTQPEKIIFDGKYIICSATDEKISLADFSKKITYNLLHTQLSTTGSFVPKKQAPPYMAGFAEVEVDLETGKVEVVEFVGIVDCGTPINPKLARIQAEGGIVTGIGLALYEEVRYASNGKLVTDNFMDYKIPTRRDIGKITVEFAPGYEDTGPYGAKSIGEVVVNTVAPAIMDAIYNACGVRIRELPATPEKIWRALNC